MLTDFISYLKHAFETDVLLYGNVLETCPMSCHLQEAKVIAAHKRINMSLLLLTCAYFVV